MKKTPTIKELVKEYNIIEFFWNLNFELKCHQDLVQKEIIKFALWADKRLKTNSE
jgi:hypothetical protein